MVDEVRAHIAQRAAAKSQPTAPIERVIHRMIGDILCDRPQVQVPVKSRGRCAAAAHGGREHILQIAIRPRIAETARCFDRRHAGRPRQPLRPIDDGPVGPHVHLVHRADDAGADPLVDEARALAGMPLVAHLGHELRILEREFAQHARLVHRGGQRLLHIDVFAGLHRRFGGRRVHVIGARNEHRVDIFFLRQHLAKIGIALRLVELLLELHALGPRLVLRIGQESRDTAFAIGQIDIADHANVVGLRQHLRVLRSHRTETDDGDVHGVARSPLAAPQYAAGHDQWRARGDHRAERALPAPATNSRRVRSFGFDMAAPSSKGLGRLHSGAIPDGREGRES